MLTVSLILEKTSKTSEEMKATAEKICSLSAEFLPIMKQEANDVIESYMREKRCSRKDAMEAIDRPLAEGGLEAKGWQKAQVYLARRCCA